MSVAARNERVIDADRNRRRSDMAEARILRGSEGETVEGAPWVFKATGASTDGHFDFMVGEVAYLSGPPLHVHAKQDDTFFVLEGTLTVQVGEEVFELGPGDFVSVPPGVPHTFDNVYERQGPVRVINLMTPAVLHDFFAEHAAAGADADPAVVRQLADDHGIERVGPTLGERLGLA
jgi:mannose-6-phosphate isomerase-like protein (cupin superfamily)